jgi:hypothetical protein|tara:strand:+ start:847 stop:1095 length:249 start_codon:yes stop_codon:yes gene_type:complete
MDIKNQIINECIDILQRDDIKVEIRNVFKPILQAILKYIYPYILISMFLVVCCFLLVLGIFISLFRMNKLLMKVLKTLYKNI